MQDPYEDARRALEDAGEPTCEHGSYPDACGEDACMERRALAHTVGMPAERPCVVVYAAAGCLPDSEPETYDTPADAIAAIRDAVYEDAAELHPAERTRTAGRVVLEMERRGTTFEDAERAGARTIATTLQVAGRVRDPRVASTYAYTLEPCGTSE